MKNRPLRISGIDVQPGEKVTLALPTPEIYSCAPLHIPIHVLHGKSAGPVLLICATFHGDEVNGIAILQRILGMRSLKSLQGTLIAIPVMNVYGLINHTRFLPDGKDLEKSFPGTELGSFAGRMAHLFSTEIFSLCTHCIAIRTSGTHMYSVPRVIYPEVDEISKNLGKVFSPPTLFPSQKTQEFFLHSEEKPTLIYQAGEINRFDEYAIRYGVRGISRVMRELGMIKLRGMQKQRSGYHIRKSTWVRAPGSGVFSLKKKAGEFVEEGKLFGVITDPFGKITEYEIRAEFPGIITGVITHPLVNEGQGIVEIGHYDAKISELDVTPFEYE